MSAVASPEIRDGQGHTRQQRPGFLWMVSAAGYGELRFTPWSARCTLHPGLGNDRRGVLEIVHQSGDRALRGVVANAAMQVSTGLRRTGSTVGVVGITPIPIPGDSTQRSRSLK